MPSIDWLGLCLISYNFLVGLIEKEMGGNLAPKMQALVTQFNLQIINAYLSSY